MMTGQGEGRAATGHYPFPEHRSVAEIDTGNQGLTPRAVELLAYLRERETTPSYDEMSAALRLKSKRAVHDLVRQLEERGFIAARRTTPSGRIEPYSIRVVDKRVNLGSVATADLVAELGRRGTRWRKAA